MHTVTLSNEADAPRTFSFSLNDGTATAADYGSATFSDNVTLSAGLITVPAGVTSFTISVPTTADAIDESDETTNIAVGGKSTTGSILDDDTATISSVTDATITEGGNLVHTVTLSNEADAPRTFSFSLTDGTATGSDYGSATFSDNVTLSAGLVTVPAGVTSFTVSVSTAADAVDESDETTHINVGGQAATGTILDDDTATISAVTDATVTEGGDLVHTVTLSNEADTPRTFTFALADGTATGGDYGSATFSDNVTLSAGLITVPAGVTSFTVSVPTTADAIDESDETTSIAVGGHTATGTIVDDDTASIQSVTDATVIEGGALVHTVTLSNDADTPRTFGFSLTDGTATGGDYGAPTFSDDVTLSGGFITVPAHVTSFTVSVPTTDDSLDESAETTSIAVGGQPATGTILDDDTATISSVTDATVTEGGDLVHTVTLSNEADAPRTFAFSLTDGTASGSDYGSATFSDNVTLSAGLITVPAGVTSFTVGVPTTADALDESNETTHVAVGGTFATGTILDNDTATISSVTDATATEGGDLVHTVTLSNEADAARTFAFSLTDGTATAADYGSRDLQRQRHAVGRAHHCSGRGHGFHRHRTDDCRCHRRV